MIYRKRGTAVRWENGTLVRVDECGVAVERGELFECHPDPGDALPPLAAPPRPHVELAERVLLLHGYAEHEYGDRTWSEETRRLHVALVHGRTRVLLDQADDDGVGEVVEALRRIRDAEPPRHLRLHPRVTAALLPALAGRERVLQSAGGFDAYGQPIVAGGSSWYRPSYRIRPVLTPANVALDREPSAVDPALPRALALLAPVTGRAVRVLMEDGQAHTFAIARIHGVAGERTWYPYGAGAYGAELHCETARL